MSTDATIAHEPTGSRLFDLLVAAERPLSVADLAEALAVHPNAVRRHLGRFLRQGLVDESAEPSRGPGRPRKLFSVRGGATAATAPAGPYERLALALLDARRSGRSLLVSGREGAAHVELHGEEPLETLVDALRADGFHPRVEDGGSDGDVTVVLDRCPLAQAAAIHPAAVCLTHRGLVEGLVARLGDLRVARLEPENPHAGGCRLLLRRDPPSVDGNGR